MKFNQYTWNLYKQSSDGQKAIKEFEEPSNNDTMMDLVFKYNPRMKLWFNDDKSRLSISNISESLWCYNICEFPDEERPNTLEEAKEKYEDVLFRGLTDNDEVLIPVNDYEMMLNSITWTSFLLYYFAPEFFFPNIFIYRFFDLHKIADMF